MAAAAVVAHEEQHVVHNADSAEKKGLKAYSTVAIHSSACPE
jgi:predicted metal-dependent TIM-barrel fold hydrolase